MTPLAREIAELIAEDGPITIARYMALCLGHPKHGYYATRDPFGPGGDFVTAPEISQMFGELIGLWSAEVWRMMGAPARFSLIELGPGRGTLMADLLRAAKAAPGFLEAAEVTLVETSPTLRAVQKATLDGRDIRWATTIDDALDASPGLPSGDEGRLPAIIVANEFFDALPIRQFVGADRGWRERLVGLDGGRLCFGLAAEPPAGLALPAGPSDALIELCPDAVAITARIARHVAAHGGAALAVDYGAGRSSGDTLQAVRGHRFADPLDAPGEADLTAHVDFGALAAAARRAGAAPMRLISQADFLERLGIAARAQALSRTADTSRRATIAAALERLTERRPTGMGALFKAFAFADPRLGAPPGFEIDGEAGST